MKTSYTIMLSLLLAATASHGETVRYTIVDNTPMTAVEGHDGWFEYPLSALPSGSTIDFNDGDAARTTVPYTVGETWHTAYTVDGTRVVVTTDIDDPVVNPDPNPEPEPDPIPDNMVRIQFVCPDTWSNPHIHIYAPLEGGDQTIVNNEPMTLSSGNTWYYMFDSSQAPSGCNIMFNNNGWGNGGWNGGEVNTGFSDSLGHVTYAVVNGSVVKSDGTTDLLPEIKTPCNIRLSGNRLTGTARGHITVVTLQGHTILSTEADGEFETAPINPGLYIVVTPQGNSKIIVR
ncbi:MAG: hypothetical protein NC117_10085 [Pseudoflavonifractor sp.]|nr:hypothetical protein [Pseudoflavonifractor sp.]